MAPAPKGTRTRGTFRMRPICQACTGPAPPKAKRGYARRSRPRSVAGPRAAPPPVSFAPAGVAPARAATRRAPPPPPRHVLVDHAVDAPGRVGQGQPHRPGHLLLHGAPCRVRVEAHPAAEEESGGEV